MQRNWDLKFQAPFAPLAGQGWWGDIGLFLCGAGLMWGECDSCLAATRDVTGLPGTGAAIGSTIDICLYFLVVFWTSTPISTDGLSKASAAFSIFPLCHTVPPFLTTF